LLAAQGLMRSVDVGDATWCDIDTIEDLHSAESLLDSPIGAGAAISTEALR
jgi:NDP-sugar pyrophosphorylase family protein